jgi:hypothetical protein
MPPASSITTLPFIVKRKYSQRQVGDLTSRGRPWWKIIDKEDGFDGDGHFYDIVHGNPQGVGGTFPGAKANVGASKGKQLRADTTVRYGYITLDGVSMLKAESKGDAAFLSLVTRETDGILEELADTLAFDLFRDGSGRRGTIASGAGTGVAQVLTLSDPDEARNFKIDMILVASTNANGTSPRAGVAKVVAVNEDAGTVTVDNSGGGGITALANTDHLFRSTENATAMQGMASHLPLTAPTGGDNFRGVDRSGDTRRLAGVRVNAPGDPIEESAGLVGVKIDQVGQQGRLVFTNPINFWAAVKRLNAKVTYDGGGAKASYGFEGIDIYSAAGSMRLVSEPFCPVSLNYVVNPETWYQKHLKGLPHIIMDDTLRHLRMTDDDGVEMRARALCNPCCTKPGANGVFAT